MGSTSRLLRKIGLHRAGRRAVLAGAAGLATGWLSGCAAPGRAALAGAGAAPLRDGAFLMPDGARLPFRAWLPDGEPESVVLALHGFGDSRDAWELPAPVFAAAGVALYAPDQRGFGETATRGRWVGTALLTDDAADMLRQLRLLHPGRRLFVIGESMGGAVAMRLAAQVRPEVAGLEVAGPGVAGPGVAGYVLVAPAVWGRAGMGLFLRSALWLLSHGLPGATIVDGGPVRVRASDNISALRRLSRDPLTLHGVRFDTLRGLVDLMDDALAAAPVLPAPTLAMYGGRDEVIPPEATAEMWRVLPPPPGVRRAFYPRGYHLMLRDHGSAVPIGDILAWMQDPAVALPAEQAAATWLAGQA